MMNRALQGFTQHRRSPKREGFFFPLASCALHRPAPLAVSEWCNRPVASTSDQSLYATRNVLRSGSVRLAYWTVSPLTMQALTCRILGTNFAEWVNDEVRLVGIYTGSYPSVGIRVRVHGRRIAVSFIIRAYRR